MSLDETGRIKLVQPPSGNECSRGPWTDQRLALLLHLYPQGLSCSVIAKRLGGGLTRNAVIGKIHRMGLPLRGQTSQKAAAKKTGKLFAARWRAQSPAGKAARTAAVAPRLSTEPLPPRHVTDVARVSFEDLTDEHCRFIPDSPTGPAEKQFCGLEVIPGSVWCRAHHARVYNAPVPRSYLPKISIGRMGLTAIENVKEFEDSH